MNHTYSPLHRFAAWLVHAFTASAAFIGLMTLYLTSQQQYLQALWLMGIAIIIDAIDGSFARLVKVKAVLPHFDGALLDNIVDYLNYVVTPCYFLVAKADMLPANWALWIVAAISMTSAYQFCQSDAKTPDHFFKGFPCYWNIALFYMFLFNTTAMTNAILMLLFCVLIFVPVKYVYPSRLDYLTESKLLKVMMHICSAIYAISTAFLLLDYPQSNPLWLGLSLAYVLIYMLLSFYRTYTPMIKAKIAARG